MRFVRHVHLDAVGGIAGDMFVAGMLDALPTLERRVLADSAAVLPADAGEVVLEEGSSGGLRARRFALRAPPAQATRPPAHADGSYRGLAERIRGAQLHEGTAAVALAILTRLAEAEARIHRRPLEEVHFHELADWDSLMDVVAAGSIAAALPATRWSVSDLPLGGGTVPTAHGRLPVPAPATAELLRGFRWRDDGIRGERVTPTGAAILAHLVRPEDAGSSPAGRLSGTGFGAGTRELPGVANVVRVLVFEPDEHAAAQCIAVMAFDVDDMTGEEIGVAAERLRGEPGVLDVSLGTRLGKKGRPLTSFRLLVEPARVADVQRRCFTETTTLGVRWRHEERATLSRRMLTTAAQDGTPVGVKEAQRPTGETRKAESDDLQHVAGLGARRARKNQAESDPE